MRYINKHTFRINIKERGYVLYTGNPEGNFKEQPIGMASDVVSPAYLSVQKRLDEILETGRVPWSMCLRHDADSLNPIVAYGGLLGVPEEHGRVGIFFIHAIELESTDFLLPYVNTVLKLLSYTKAAALTQALARAAVENIDVVKLLITIGQRVEDLLIQTPKNEFSKHGIKRNIGFIEHDCAGGEAIAWLTAAHLYNRRHFREAYDDVGRNGNTQTVIANGNQETIFASDIQRLGIKHYLYSLDINDSQQGSSKDDSQVKVQVASTPDVPPTKRTEGEDENKETLNHSSDAEEISSTKNPEGTPQPKTEIALRYIQTFIWPILIILLFLLYRYDRPSQYKTNAVNNEFMNNPVISDLSRKLDEIQQHLDQIESKLVQPQNIPSGSPPRRRRGSKRNR